MLKIMLESCSIYIKQIDDRLNNYLFGQYILNSIIEMESKRYQMFNVRSEQVKFNAFFQYLKSFSEAGLDTLQRLENDFNKQMRKKLKNCQALSTIKNLLSSYEIFILQIKDSCDFVEISQFGYCIGKTFLQLLKIIKWFLKAWIKDSRKYEKAKSSLQSQPNQQINIDRQNLCAFCDQLIKTTPYGREMKGKRKGVAINDLGNDMRDAKINHKKQMNHLMDMKENILQRYTLKEIASKKNIDLGQIDILNRKHIAMKLQISNNQTVLEEVLNQFSLKTEAMSRFVCNTQANFIQDFKMNQEVDYVLFEEQMKASIAQKYNQARQKLKTLVFLKLADHDKHRKDKLVQKQVQTNFQDYSDREKNQVKIKQLTSACQRLKNELESQKAMSQSLKKLLQSKSIEFEKQFLNFRKEVIKSDIKSKHYLKSLKSFKSGMQQVDDQDQDKASIKLDKLDQSIDFGSIRSNQMNASIRHKGKLASGNFKDRKIVKNRYSIKFAAVQEDSNIQQQAQNQNINLNESIEENLNLTNSVEVQTDPICILDQSISPEFIKSSYLASTHQSGKGKLTFKQYQQNKIISQKKLLKKTQTHLYSHIKSKVFNMIENQSNKSVRKDFKQSRSSCMGQLVKKLSVDYLYRKKQLSITVKLFKLISDPVFIQITSYCVVKQDLINLYLNDKNTHTYQCLIYRNTMFNLANFNQKRLIGLSKQVQASDIEQIMKKESPVSETVENRVVYAFNVQLTHFRKKQKHIYTQIKQLLRSPYQISKKVQVVQLQGSQTNQKDLDVSELKKMLNIILKFHSGCIGEEKDSICQHIVNFSQKMGIKFL